MTKQLSQVCEEMLLNKWVLAANEESFKRTRDLNMKQVKSGDLDYDGQDPYHVENGRRYSVLSTSQVSTIFTQ